MIDETGGQSPFWFTPSGRPKSHDVNVVANPWTVKSGAVRSYAYFYDREPTWSIKVSIVYTTSRWWRLYFRPVGTLSCQNFHLLKTSTTATTGIIRPNQTKSKHRHLVQVALYSNHHQKGNFIKGPFPLSPKTREKRKSISNKNYDTSLMNGQSVNM